jgi:heme/copper-type cytochrome/quinol oxidase subunit 2
MITEPFRPVRGIGVATSVLIGLEALFAVADAIVTQNTANVVQEYTDGNGTMEDLRAADALTLMVTVPGMLVTIAAGVTFIVWIYRSRRNAERVTYSSEHRHKRGWVIGSWFTPIVNLWFPLQIVQDVWRAFDPRQQDRPLQARDNNGFVLAWWLVFLLMTWGDRGVARLALRDADFATIATWTWVTTVVTIVAAAFAVVLVRRLTDLQDQTKPAEFSGPVQVHVPGA